MWLIRENGNLISLIRGRKNQEEWGQMQVLHQFIFRSESIILAIFEANKSMQEREWTQCQERDNSTNANRGMKKGKTVEIDNVEEEREVIHSLIWLYSSWFDNSELRQKKYTRRPSSDVPVYITLLRESTHFRLLKTSYWWRQFELKSTLLKSNYDASL